MKSVLSDEELATLLPDFTLWARARRIGVHDELFVLVRRLLLSGDDARTMLVDYIAGQASEIREGTAEASAPRDPAPGAGTGPEAGSAPTLGRDEWFEQTGGPASWRS